MYKLLLAFITIAFQAPAYSQSDILANFPFNSTTEGWGLENSATTESSIANGHLKLKNKNTESAFFKNQFAINPSRDFYIETKIKNDLGDKGSYGIYLSDYRTSQNSRWYYFLLAPGGAFWICENSTKNTTYTYHKTGSVEKDIFQGSDNTLAIEKKGTITNFYINGKNVFQLSNSSFWGEYVGFTLFGKFDLSVDHLLIKQKHTGINLIEDTGVKYTKENLGAQINSKDVEVYPIISADEKTLYFVVENKATVQYDIYYSTKNADGSWSKRKNIGVPLNTKDPDYVINVTPDNNSLLVANEYQQVNGEWRGYLGFSMTHKTATGWSAPEKITVDNFYNNALQTSYCLSPNRKVLLLSIERDDSYGSNDFYVSFLKKDGTWTEPKHMGPMLNTYASEATPSIAADGKTLYFSTSGKPGYGSNDIFVSKRLDDSWTKWSEPQNLGPDINTKHWDGYYSVPASGEYAYVVSDDNGYGDADIFKIKIEKTAKPEPVVIIYGHTYNKATNKPIEANISYHELISGEESGIAKSNATDGSYKIILPYSKAYGFLAEKKNFLSESNNIDLTEIKEFKEIRQDLYLTPLEVGKTVSLNNVFFEKSKPELLAGSNAELDRLVKIMETNPTLKIDISGHTDNVGDPAKNIELSEQRVKTIKNYLVSKGISAKRISGKGYGGTKPIASNSSEETRKLNRRVEFTIVK